ncbi:MAG: cupin domain-containing protein [Thiohalocapsa sp.]
MAKRIDIAALPAITGTLYPSPYDEPCRTRERKRLGDAAGLTQYGVNLLRLPAGAWSSQRHWHTGGDEFVYVLSGEVVLVTDDGDEILKAGDCAGFKAGDKNGHCLQNRSAADATVLEIGSRIAGEAAYYPGIDLMATGSRYLHTDGTPYPKEERR